MSLAPDERRNLARIEDSLRRSDPRLATWLATFRLPARLRLLVGWERAIMRGRHLGGRRWPTRLAVVTAGIALLSLIVIGGLALGRARLPACAGHGVRTSAFGRRVLTCQQPGGGLAGKPAAPGTGSRPGAAMTAGPRASAGLPQAGNPAGRSSPPPGSGSERAKPAHA
jgi:hypothetical protein